MILENTVFIAYRQNKQVFWVSLCRQLQVQQILQQLQQQENFAKLSPQQQQQLAVQLLIKQQTQIMQQQQQPGQAPPGQQPAQPPQKLSPRYCASPLHFYPQHIKCRRVLLSPAPSVCLSICPSPLMMLPQYLEKY